MKDFLENLLLCLIPLFVAIDAIGVLPLFVNLTEGMEEKTKNLIARQSVLTAFLVALCFVFLGEWIFSVLGIKLQDFMIAGGILLLTVSIADIVRYGEKGKIYGETAGAVPLGTPLLAGPATLTTTLILVGNHGYILVITALTLNLFFAWLIFSKAHVIIKFIGINGTRAVAKVAALFLAAIAIKLIRAGILELR
ncbi:MAG: MarC family protein [bacterium]